MKAAVLYKANTRLEVVDVEQQAQQAGEARVRVMATGVCHSDWHIINGDWTLPLPMVLGHEAAGVVEEVGPGVSNVRRGDHIIFSFRPHCGRCFYCSSGRSILCDGYASARFVMLDGTHRLRRNGQDINQMARLGTFAESVVCPAEMLVPISRDMPWPQAALIGCAVPTGVGAVTRCAQVEAGASVLVIGCGGVGLNVVQGARLAGARTIIACDLLENKLAFAREFGATDTWNAKEGDVAERVRKLTGGRGADYAFDAIGSEATTLQILDAIRPGGLAVIVGMAPMTARAPITPYTMALQEKTLRGAENAPNQPIIRIGALEIGEMSKRPRTAAVGQVLHRRAFARHPHYAVAHARGYDPESHLAAMDIEGIDVAVLYGTRGRQVLMPGDLDPEVAAALARAHNDWTRAFCAGSPDRLKFAAQLAFHAVGLAVQEARRAVRELGAVAVVGNPNPVRGRHVHYPELEPLWDAIEELGLPVGFHPTGQSSLRDDIPSRHFGHPNGPGIAAAGRNPMGRRPAFARMAGG